MKVLQQNEYLFILNSEKQKVFDLNWGTLKWGCAIAAKNSKCFQICVSKVSFEVWQFMNLFSFVHF